MPRSLLLATAALLALAAPAAAEDSGGFRGSLNADGTSTGIGGVFVSDALPAPDPLVTAAIPGESTNPPRTVAADPDPFAPAGIPAAGLILFPAVELLASANRTGSDSGWSLLLSPEFTIESDWRIHAMRFVADAEVPVAGPGAPTVIAASASADFTFDLPNTWQSELGLAFAYGPQTVSDGSITDPRGFHSRTLAAALRGPLGPVVVSASAEVERVIHDDAYAGIVPVDQSDGNLVRLAGTLRVSGDGGAIITPFIEVSGGRFVHDNPIGADAYAQDSTYAAIRGGFTYDSAPVLTAEVAVGYRRDTPADPSLSPLAGITIDASSNWSPRELIVVTFGATTTFATDPTPTSGGSISRDLTLRAAYSATDTVTVAADATRGFQRSGAGDVDKSFSLGGEVAWTPNRWFNLALSFSHEWLASTTPPTQSTSDSIALTARLQH